TAYLTVTSGTQSRTANCQVVVNQVIINHDHKTCYSNNVYWYDSNNIINDIYQTCTTSQICQNAQCVNIVCSNNSGCGTSGPTGGLFCQLGNVYQNYITYTCNNPGTTSSTCTNSIVAQPQTTCTGNQTCSNGSCVSNCTTHSYRNCVGRNAYWFNSCDAQEGLAEDCGFGTCQAGQCILNSFSLSCVPNPTQAYANQLVTFNSFIDLPTNSTTKSGVKSMIENPTYYYTWSNACTSSSNTCSKSFPAFGTYTANLSVTIGNVTKSTSCSVNIHN
ncbi:MAG: hypothetical protein NT094_04865, partial [Candidatus Staskawiczbacteria bacterium]|nr:hypothetical protein [Candidatus Staskawiczbacteria bacterium]